MLAVQYGKVIKEERARKGLKQEELAARAQVSRAVLSRLERQRVRHLRLAVELAQDGRAASALVARARKRVELWRANKSCSPFYIERWSSLLALPPRRIAREMSTLGEWENALFQNSPWSWAWS